MQQKGEREIMTNGECCRYIRTYSELEGLQHACTLVYCAASTPQGVLAQLRREQGGREVLEDVHQPYQLLDTSKNAMNMAEEPVFCGICRF